MSRAEPPWARHYQEQWQERAGDPNLPHWLRVAALAYGTHRDNGHATFKRGDIALVLGSVDTRSGEITPYANVGRAIRTAVAYGWLAGESFWGCLVVPAHAIKKGNHGHAPTCPVHIKRTAKPSLSERNAVRSSTLSERFNARSRHSVSGSKREPLSLVSPDAPAADPTNEQEAG